jgi:hypothetical protein
MKIHRTRKVSFLEVSTELRAVKLPLHAGFDSRWGLLIFFNVRILPAALGLGVYSASNRNEYRKISGGKAQPVRRADNLAAIREPTV